MAQLSSKIRKYLDREVDFDKDWSADKYAKNEGVLAALIKE